MELFGDYFIIYKLDKFEFVGTMALCGPNTLTSYDGDDDRSVWSVTGMVVTE